MQSKPNKPSREEMIKLVKEVQATSACVVDFDALMNRLEQKLGSREIGTLIFDPPGGTPLSAEEIVDRVLGE